MDYLADARKVNIYIAFVYSIVVGKQLLFYMLIGELICFLTGSFFVHQYMVGNNKETLRIHAKTNKRAEINTIQQTHKKRVLNSVLL